MNRLGVVLVFRVLTADERAVLLAQRDNRRERGGHTVGQYPLLCVNCEIRFFLTDGGSCPSCGSRVDNALPLYRARQLEGVN